MAGSFRDKVRPKSFPARYPQWMVGWHLLISSSALASLGDAMFGYSQGAIAALQVQPPSIRRFFGKDVTIEQIQAGNTGIDPYRSLNITTFIAALAAAYVCDVLSRRISLRLGGIVYFVAALIQIFSPNLASLIVGRSLQGVGVGMLSMTVPIIQCEIAPGYARGFFISIEYLCLNAGYALSAWVGYGFFFALPHEISWKGVYVVQAAMALVLCMWSFVIPETPRFLIKNGFLDEGLRVLADLHADGNVDDADVRQTLREIQDTVRLEAAMGEASWAQVFNGINAILYFLPENLLRAGFTVEKSLLYAGVSSIMYCAGTVPTMFGIDRLVRRPFLITGSFALAAALAVVGGVQFYPCVYLFFYGATWGPGPWLLGAEIFPMRARAKGMALSTTSNWVSNFIIAFITPPVFAAIGGGYYFILLGFCIVSGRFVFFVYPETALKSLEELGSVFNDQSTEEVEKMKHMPG
ncbi:general substrate transporter [Daedaleopsis nitida]|nr:general substrate transporter [Daedaleopsis nitida]